MDLMDLSTDIDSQLLGALQGDDGMDSGSANALGMIQALQQYGEKAASGQKRSPFGQVADALQTMLAMKIYGQQIQRQMMKQRLDRELKLSLIRQRLESGQLKREKAEREKQDAPLHRKVLEGQAAEYDNPYRKLPAELQARLSGKPEVAAALQGEDERKLGQQKKLAQYKVNLEAGKQKSLEDYKLEKGLEAARKLGLGGAPGGTGETSPSPTGVLGPEQKWKPTVRVGPVTFSSQTPKVNPKDVEAIVGAQQLVGMRPQIDEALAGMPDEFSGIASQANKYLRGKKATSGNGVASIVNELVQTHLRGEVDPSLVRYFTAVGQFNVAVTQAGLALSGRGGKWLAEELSPHIPQLGDSPRVVRDKVQQLYAPDGIMAQRALPNLRRLIRAGEVKSSDTRSIIEGFGLAVENFRDSRGHLIAKATDGNLYDLGAE